MHAAKNSPSLIDNLVVGDLHAHPELMIYLLKSSFRKKYRSLEIRFSDVDISMCPLRTSYPRLKEGKVNFLVSAIHVPERKLAESPILKAISSGISPQILKEDPYILTLEMMDEFESIIEDVAGKKHSPRITLARSPSELEIALNSGYLVILHSIEGAHSLSGNVDNLNHLYDRGVCMITLAHFFPNEAVSPTDGIPPTNLFSKIGCFDEIYDENASLTPFGRTVVERMAQLGILIDMAHCTVTGRKDIMDMVGSRVPLVMSHVGFRGMKDIPYNVDAGEIRRIADTGGVLGIIFMNYYLSEKETEKGLDLIVETAEQFKNYGGIDCVALGSDFDGFTDPPLDLKTHSSLPCLIKRLEKRFTRSEIEKIAGGNILRVLRQGWNK